MAEMTDNQLEQELANRKLAKEQQILNGSGDVSTVNVVEGAVGPTLMLELSVEGLQVAAVVDTASNSTIISRSMLHDIKHHLQTQGKPMPQLELPCVPLYGKGQKGSHWILLLKYHLPLHVMVEGLPCLLLFSQRVSRSV